MLYLLLTLLLFGFVQSLLELKKDSEEQTRWQVERILSIVYILGFLVGLIVIILQDKESSKTNNLINDISLAVTKIDTNSIKQVQKLGKTLEETKSLIKITDSMNKNMREIIKIRDLLIVQTKEINNKLYKQLEIDKQALKEKDANIALMDYDIKWTGKDSTSQSIEACIRNFGKRNAIVIGGVGYVVFFNYQKNSFFNLNFPGNTIKGILQSNELQGAKLCYYSYGVNNFNLLKANTFFAVICLKITYKDALSEKEKTENFYSGWLASSNVFGGLKNWQI